MPENKFETRGYEKIGMSGTASGIWKAPPKVTDDRSPPAKETLRKDFAPTSDYVPSRPAEKAEESEEIDASDAAQGGEETVFVLQRATAVDGIANEDEDDRT